MKKMMRENVRNNDLTSSQKAPRYKTQIPKNQNTNKYQIPRLNDLYDQCYVSNPLANKSSKHWNLGY
jgi:hypothetical protein